MTDLQSDEEFLLSLYERPAKARTTAVNDPKFMASAIALLKTAPEGAALGDPEQFVRDLFDPNKAFRGAKAELLRKSAARFLTPDEQELLTVPIGFLLTEELNGRTIRTPRGGTVILMYDGVILHMQMLARALLALTTWSASKPFCRDHEPAAWLQTIGLLAKHVITSRDEYLERITTWHCASLDEWDLESANYATQIELFVLMHEYGHASLGHLQRMKTAVRNGLDAFQTRHELEFEADRYAVMRQAAQGMGDAALISAGAFLRFGDLIEKIEHGGPYSSGTHPASRDRWQRIKSLDGVSEQGAETAAEIDSVFDMVARFAHAF